MDMAVRRVVRLPDADRAERRERRDRDLSSASDLALAWQAKAGDAEAFSHLFRRYHRRLHRICLRWTHSAPLADDLVQDTFLRAFTSVGSFQADRPVLPWLQSIARNRLIDLRRVEARSKQISLDEHMDGRDDDPEDDLPEIARSAEEDPTLQAVLDAGVRARLRSALAQLTPRHRRVLMLYAVEGWSHNDIAAAEGLSRAAIKSLIFRARACLRSTREVGLLGILLGPPRALARLLGAWRSMRARSYWLSLSSAEGTALLTAQQMIAATLALALSVIGLTSSRYPTDTATAAGIATRDEGEHAREATIAFSVDQELRADAHGMRRMNISGEENDATIEGSLDKTIESRSKGWVRWTIGEDEDRTQPEDTVVRSITFSPNFSSDGTIFVTGDYQCYACTVPMALFRSTDRGATWRRLPAKLLSGRNILLPPAYGVTDHRIFAGAENGLQVSDDNGDSFRYISPVVRKQAAISPAFNEDDPRIMLGNFQYDDRFRTTTPAPYVTNSSMGLLYNPAFSPSYAEDHLILFGGAWSDGTHGERGSVFRCIAMRCTGFRLQWGFPRFLFTSDFSTSHTVFAFSSAELYRSFDAAVSFSKLEVPWTGGGLTDLAIAPSGRLFAAVAFADEHLGLYASDDLGVTWHRVEHPLFGNRGVLDIALSGNRIIAALANGWRTDLVCSADGGITWARRCPAAA